MVGITEIGAAIGGLKSAMEVAKGLNAVANTVALNEAKIALQTAILAAQESLLAAQEAQAAHQREMDALRAEIARLKSWDAEKERYKLVDVWRGAMAYMPKQIPENSEPAHWLCANCFNIGRKSFLVFKGQDRTAGGSNLGESTYGCDTCKSSIKVSFRSKPSYEDATANR